MSVFFAVHVSNALGPEVAELLRRVATQAPSCSRVAAADAHLTLAFLGQLEPARVERARALGRATTGVGFDLSMGPLGCFGGRAPRVLWWGPAAVPEALGNLQRDLSDNLRAGNFELEERPYAPHLTLARAKGPRAARELASFAESTSAPARIVPVRTFVLMRTAARPDGARYEIVESFPLAEARP